ncbi:meiotic recombination protein rec14 [Diplogelasinospora grovesii]|uniref:Meiotic recombination protein rec14 n=1 Tax=Diplogelasinospora grovesii TaxID=303347 RepID=A0AAN6N199_9PEZI|nr:meiotic recombination protein rec14 [Diplogelasinospora grovesii]
MSLAAQSMRIAPTGSILPRISALFSTQRPASLMVRSLSLPFFPSLVLAVPASFHLGLPPLGSILEGIWESILKAVPKKKTSHMKKRHRQMAGKALKDVTSLCKCPSCGQTKRMHYLCPHCASTHKTGIFSLAPTPTSVISASGSSALHIHNTTEPSFPLQQSLEGAHKLGCHHVCTARDGPGNVFASVGFGSEIKVWRNNKESGKWELWWELPPSKSNGGDVWAVALSSDENYLAFTTSGGKIHVWDLTARERIRTYDTGSGSGSGTAAGSFAMAVDLSRDGKLTASGHENGGVYVFNNDTGKLAYSLSGLAKPVRAVAFSPGCKRLAAAGNAGVIALYDMVRGEHVQNLSALSTAGFNSWITSIDWNDTGDYLLSGSLDGRVRVWDVNREACVATHSESDGVLWSVRWLPKTERALAPGMGKGELFCAAGESKNITFYREATGI